MCDCNGGVKKGKEKPKSKPSEKKTCPLLTCKYNILGPQDVPGLSKYKYKIDIPTGKTATNIKWTVDKATAGFDGPINKVEVTATFQNTTADWIKLRADFKLDGKEECAEKHIALVKVDVEAPTFTKPGKPSGSSSGTKVFLVNPPTPPATPKWVTTNDPGSNCGAFIYNGTLQASEPRKFIGSNRGGGGSAYKAETNVKLSAPTEKPGALQQIEVGYIQHGSDSGSATYATTPPGKTRTVHIPTTNTVDWLSSPCSPGGTDEWPWYDMNSRETGSGTGTWTKTLELSDSPSLSIPAQYNPNAAPNANATKAVSSAAETFTFVIRMAARTKNTDLDANKHYFDHAYASWFVNFAWPVVPGISIVTTDTAWTKPSAPSEIDINVVPTVTNHNAPFIRWIPS